MSIKFFETYKCTLKYLVNKSRPLKLYIEFHKSRPLKINFPHHFVIQDTIRDRNAGILRVQRITDDMNVGLLLYLDRREQAKLYTVTRNEKK